MVDSASDPATQARLDWSSRRAVVQHYGDIHADRPLISRKGFYVSVSWDEAYARSYNAAINELLKVEGMPDWAPGKRLPTETELREACRVAEPINLLQPESRAERRVVESRFEARMAEHGTKHSHFRRIRGSHVLLLLLIEGTHAVVDVVDTLQMCWMASLELTLEREVGG
jgi:hypothetical protein